MFHSDCPHDDDISITATVVVTDPVAKQATFTTQNVTGAGAVAAGATSMSFFNYGPSVASVNGGDLAVHAALALPPVGSNVTFGEINYDAGTSLLRVDVVRVP